MIRIESQMSNLHILDVIESGCRIEHQRKDGSVPQLFQRRLLDAIWQKKIKEVVKVLLHQTQILLLRRLDASLQTPHYPTHRVVLS